jgi:hypothetical protein
MLFYVSTIGVLGSNRQLIALAICMYSLKFVIEKKPFHFLISVMFAFLFHSSALLFLVYYFLNRDFSKLHILAMLLIAFVIGKSSLPSIAFSGLGNLMSEASASKVSTYSEKGSLGDFSLSLIGFVRRITYFIIFIWSYNSLTKKWPSYKLMFNGFLFGLLFYLAFSSSLLILVNRGSLYFNIMEVFLITCQLLFFKSHKNILAILFVIFLYSFYIFFQSISVYSDLFLPYKGIFINSEYKRDLY